MARSFLFLKKKNNRAAHSSYKYEKKREGKTVIGSFDFHKFRYRHCVTLYIAHCAVLWYEYLLELASSSSHTRVFSGDENTRASGLHCVLSGEGNRVNVSIILQVIDTYTT